jgi:hypothetical protein
MHPFQLDSGIYLESIQTLVPWGTAIEDLPQYGSPVVTQKPNGIWVDWRGVECLGGVLCGVGACQLVEPATPNAYHVFLPEFHWAHLILARGRYLTRDLLRRTFRHLKDHFGPPHYFYADYYGGLPSVWWQFDRLKVSVGPEYGNDRISIVVSHEPSGFEDLRQQAAQWETEHGVGAREDYKEGAVVI